MTADRRNELLDVLNELDVADVPAFVRSQDWDADDEAVVIEFLTDAFDIETLRRWAGRETS